MGLCIAVFLFQSDRQYLRVFHQQENCFQEEGKQKKDSAIFYRADHADLCIDVDPGQDHCFLYERIFGISCQDDRCQCSRDLPGTRSVSFGKICDIQGVVYV